MRFLIISYFQKPNGQMDETLSVVKNLKLREVQTGSVILDFKKLQVVKATIGGENVPKDWDTIVAYYYEHYKATIERMFIENGYAAPIVEPVEETKEEPTAE